MIGAEPWLRIKSFRCNRSANSKTKKRQRPQLGRLCQPDIYETNDALTVILEMPGVEKNNVDVRVEDDILRVNGQLDLSKYKGLLPLYTEYNIGNYSRNFRLSNKIDQNKIAAEVKDGVLWLTLPKAEEAKPRTIEIK